MCAKSAEELQRSRRRKRLVKGLVVGGAAIGLPALANVLVRRRVGRLPAARWGRTKQYSWHHGDIAYQQLGKGPALVLLHSFGPGHDSEQWRQAAELLATDFEVFAVDLLGWGRSAKPQITYDGELYIQQLTDFIQDVVGRRAIVAAAGLSAAYSIQVAVDHPDLLQGLFLLVPMGIEVNGDEPDLKDALVHRMLRLPVLGTSALNLYTSRSGIVHHLRELYAAPERVDASLVDRHYRASHQDGAQASMAAFLAGYLNHGVEELLGRLETPTILAWGRKAVFPPVETADLWLRSLDAELKVFETSGSLPHAEQPNAIRAELIDFANQLSD